MFLEDQYAENLHTFLGTTEHERVDHSGQMTHADVRVLYALPVWHTELNLVGRCDVVEIWKDGTIFPVEYKHSPRRRYLNDDLQLAAQALCLEEMFQKPVRKGAIFHTKSKRRREVEISEGLRQQLTNAVAAINTLFSQEDLPPPTPVVKRCDECAMRPICQPEMLRQSDTLNCLHQQLFDCEE